MRELKFRAYDKTDTTEDAVSPTNDFAGWVKIVGMFGDLDLRKTGWIFMQYIGIKDKNGKEIYEGDICRVKALGRDIIGKVFFNENKLQFGLDAIVETEIEIPSHAETDEWEVLGNIYQNPELLPKE